MARNSNFIRFADMVSIRKVVIQDMSPSRPPQLPNFLNEKFPFVRAKIGEEAFAAAANDLYNRLHP